MGLTQRTLVIDGNNIAMRAVKAAEHRVHLSVEVDGRDVNTGPLLLFINLVSKYIRQTDPHRVVVCWDGGRSAHRAKIYPGYKAERKDASAERDLTPFSLDKEFLTLSGIHHIEMDGVEADDLVAAYWHRKHNEERLTIVSGDKDFLQLLDGWTEQMRPGGQTPDDERWTANRVRTEKGCKPEQIPLVMALTGDSGDCQPLGTRVLKVTRTRPAWNRNLTDGQADLVRQRLAEGKGQSEVAREFGVSLLTVRSILHGKTYGASAGDPLYQWVPIESLDSGDKVVSRGKDGEWTTRPVMRTRTMDGPSTPLVVVETDGGRRSSYTSNHRCMARTNLYGGGWVVYLMRRGDAFRVGMTRCTPHAGPKPRMGDEDGDALWVLSSHATEGEARLAEQLVSWQYSLPDVRFLGAKWVEQFWSKMGDLTEKAEKCLIDHGRELSYPLYTRGSPPIWGNRISEIRACNLMAGMSAIACSPEGDRIPRGTEWDRISVIRREWSDAQVVGLEVEGTALYVSDGMLTHNSIPGIPGFGDKTAVKFLARYDWDLQDLLDAEEPKLQFQAVAVRRNLALVDLRTPIPGIEVPEPPRFEPTTPGSLMYDHLQEWLTVFHMDSVLTRLANNTLWKA